MTERVDPVVVGAWQVAQDRAPEAHVDGVGLRCDRDLHLLHRAAVGDDAPGSHRRRDGARELHVQRLQLPDVAGQPHGEAVGGDRQQRPGLLQAGHPRNRLGQPSRLTEGPDAEDRRRAAVQHDPVVEARGGEERSPALFTHRKPPRERCPSQPDEPVNT